MNKRVQVQMQQYDALMCFWSYTLNARISSLFVLDSLTIRKTFWDLNWHNLISFLNHQSGVVSNINTHKKSYFLSCTTSPPHSSSRLVLFSSPLSSPSVFSRPCLPCADLIRPLFGNKECRHLFSGKIKTYRALRLRAWGCKWSWAQPTWSVRV